MWSRESPLRVAELQQGSYPPGPADLTEHVTVVRQLIELRAGGQLGDGGLAEVATRIEKLIAAGRGGEGLTATAEPPSSLVRRTSNRELGLGLGRALSL